MSRIGRLFQKFRRATPAPERPETREPARWVIVGLGNPDRKFQGSRHNIGFMVVDRLAEKDHTELKQRKFKGLLAEVQIGDERAILIKPQTYYNLTGESVAPLAGYYNVPAERVIVVHDELDLEPGRLRIRRGGGDAGNRGVRSIIEGLATPDFIRVRVGIGHPPEGIDTKDYILTPMKAAERKILEASIERAAEAVAAILADGLAAAMNRYNQRV